MHIVSIDPEPEYLTRRQAAAVLGLAETTLRRWYAENRGPRVVKIGTARAGRVRYSRADLLAWANDPTGYAVQTRPENLPRFAPPSRGNPKRRRKVAT